MDKSEQAGFLSEVASTTERLVHLLGFHDLISFLITLAFTVLALAFGVTAAISLINKRRSGRLKPGQETESPKEVGSPEKIAKPEQAIELPKEVRPLEKIAEPEQAVELPKEEVAPEKIAEPEQAIELPKEVRSSEKIAEPEQAVELPKEVRSPEKIPEPKKSHALEAALKNTRSGFMHKLSMLFRGGKDVSDEDFAAMEAILFGADIGVKTTQKLLDAMRERALAEKKSDPAFIKAVLKDEMKRIFAQGKRSEKTTSASPDVFMFVGVNGAGKTTSIGKLGAQMVAEGKKVFFGAGDTYRAAAVKQLCLWGEKIGAEVVCGAEKSDSASVLFDTIKKGKAALADVILCDTAGRLHTKAELMDELAKIKRVVNKAHEGAPQEVFLVVDATMGQNAIMQAREFAQSASLTGVILSKLDGSAKGGVALGIVDELKIPIRYVGIGEQANDLREFNADDFVEALFEEA